MLRKHFFVWVLLVSCALGALGLVHTADNVTHRVLNLVNQLSWTESVGPFFMPFPIDATAFRPLSVLGLKAYSTAFGIGPPPFWVSFLKSVVCLSLFALSARKWLHAVGLRNYAEWAAILPLGLAPVLFQTWYLPEFDLLGAAACLMLSALLLQRAPLGRMQMTCCVGLLAFSLFLKESTALVQLAFLSATAIGLWAQGLRGARFKRHGLLCIGGALAWGGLVLPLLKGQDSQAAAAPFLTRVGLVEHNLVQILYLLSTAGAVLLFLGGALVYFKSAQKHLKTMLPASVAVLLLAPIAVFYSHYEAVYFAPRWMGIGWALVLFTGLFFFVRSSLRTPAEALVAMTILGVVAALSLAGLTAPNAREDMASRVFVVLAPGLFALALGSVDRCRKALANQGKPGLARASLSALLVALIYTPIAQAFNYTSDWRARHAVDYEAKKRMAQWEGADFVLFNHYVEWLDPLGLMAAGAPDTVQDWQFLHVPAWLPISEYAQASWILPYRVDLFEKMTKHSTHIYWLTPRLQGHENARGALQGDLSWTRKALGLFSPVAKGLHNRPEDHRMTVYRKGPSPLESIMAQGDALWSDSANSWQLPLNLFEAPRRLVEKVPLVEQFRVEGRLVHLPAGRFQIEE
jgi:hypothetical protein